MEPSLKLENGVATWFMPVMAMPKPRMTQRSKWAHSEFNDWVGYCRLNLQSLMNQSGIQPFPKVSLWMSATFGLPKNKVWKVDLSNLLKAVEDVMQKVLFFNDAWIEEYREVKKGITQDIAPLYDSDFFEVRIGRID